MMKKLRLLVALFAMLLGVNFAYGQGTTTASITGVVKDTNGEVLTGATVIAVHTPTGSQYGNISNVDGRFRIANMQVGGPYTVTVSFVGYQNNQKNNVFLTLGQTLNLSFELKEESTELEEVVVTASNSDIFDGNKTGASTVVGEDQINAIPTISRQIGDFVKLNPQATVTEGSEISINGQNNRYNAIYIDGAVNNDVFGLASSGTNGGQTGGAPISIDAIEEFQISVAPFDVRQSGFAGGAINAVTRSGTNQFEGSVYHFWRNQNLAGKTPNTDDDREKLADFTAQTTGLRVGGPIIKNKLFFFVSGEIQRDETPQPFDFNDYRGDASREQINQLVSKLNAAPFNYNPGGFENNTSSLDADRFLIKLDWNVNQNHKVSLRTSYTNLEQFDAFRSSPTSISFLNGAIFFPSETISSALEVKSAFGNNISNNLIIGYTTVRDDRDPAGQNFPTVRIDDGAGTIFFGSEAFSTANRLDTDVLTITNNLELYKGRHTITFGTHNEFYSVLNLFVRQNYGQYFYADGIESFLNDEPATFYDRSYSLIDNVTGDESNAAAIFDAMQLGFYVQDEFQATDNLKLTGGIRIDIPIYNDNTPENTQFNSETIPLIEAVGYDLEGARSGSKVSTQALIAPRLGFNWDVKGDQNTQVRGGLGVFTSRSPFVWVGGTYNNTGVNVGGDDERTLDNFPFGLVDFPRWDQQPQSVQAGQGQPSGQVDLFAEDFKLPQVFKANLAVDQKLPWGLVGTLEAMYTKTLNGILYQNLNIRPSEANLTGTPDNRPIFNRRDPVDRTYTGIYLGTNTSKGYTYNLTAQLTKPFDNGFMGSIAYSYGDAFSVYDGTSSQNSSQWRGLHSIQGRNGFNETARSDFSQGHRVIASVSYRKEYLGFGASQISLFYEGQSGRPFSYIYNDGGALTNEDSRERNMIFVPATQNDIILVEENGISPQEQWNNLNAFIEANDYLSGRRGQYAERNGDRVPFSNVIDLRFLQEVYLEMGNGQKNILQFSVDIFNFTNMLNKDWGKRWFTDFDGYEILDFEGFQADGTTPTFSFTRNIDDANNPLNNIDDSGLVSSRWQMQLGIRYIFR